MISLFFFLKFKSQLRRTRPDITRQIDELLTRLITEARGKITGERLIISAIFNEDTIGFWLDIFILIENLKNKIDAIPDFFGYSLIICDKVPDAPELLCRYLANHSGVFIDEKAAENLFPYAVLEKPFEWMKKNKKRKYSANNYYRIKEFKSFRTSVKNELELQSDVTNYIEQEDKKNILISGPSYWHIRGSLYRYNDKLNRDFPPMTVCFESIGIGALVDIWSPNIRALAPSVSQSQTQLQLNEEIDGLWDFLFRERIRGEVSDYVNRCLKRFLSLVFNFYFDAAKRKRKTPVLMLENIHLAETGALNIFLDALAAIDKDKRDRLLLLGTFNEDCPNQEALKQSEEIFESRMTLKIKANEVYCPKLSSDLWEIIYAISIFSRFFSPEFFLRLFEEAGKNAAMITKAFSILQTLGIIESVREPKLIKMHLIQYAVKTLENKTARVEAMVSGRLLDWAVKRNINPCFRLLTTIFSFEHIDSASVKKIDDLLLLKSFLFDIVSNTTCAIKEVIDEKEGQFDELFGDKADALRYLYKSSLALNCGDENDIENIFSNGHLDKIILACEAMPVFKAQLIINYCSYYFGINNEKAASAKAKEVILLGQSRNSYCLSHGYRLYSLVCLSKQQINETIEYLGFALSNAEKNGDYHELAVSSYYAAAAQFLHGDIFKASSYAQKSTEYSLTAGCPDWADRANFLQGRLKFELGQYGKACDIFEKLHNNPYDGMSDDKKNTLLAWIYRAKVYMKEYGIKRPESAEGDANLFEAEAEYLAGNYKRSFEICQSMNEIKFSARITSGNFIYSERPDWRSGFTQCEQLYFTNGEIQQRIITMFRSLAQSRLSGDSSEESKMSYEITQQKQCALDGIQEIIRDEKLCEMDPWDSLYFFAKYRIQEQSGASSVDMSTAVSIAFKRLQRRACRIEDVETRSQYLNGNRWNRELCQSAKEFKLI